MSKSDHDRAADRAAERAGDPFDGILDEVTSSLRDDTELRLDVRAELATHLEDKRDDFRAKGHAEEESAELAAQALGPPDALARDLLAANRRRMKLRALVRLTLRAVVLPATVLAVLSIPVHRTAFLMLMPLSISSSSDGRGPGIVTTESFDILMRDDMPPPEPMYWAGDGAWYSGLRAAWEADISNAPLAARYLRAFAGHVFHDARHLNDTLSPIPERRRPLRGFKEKKQALTERLATFERDIRRAERIDPENACWRYLLAGVLARAAVRRDRVLRRGPPDRAEDIVVVLDQAMFGRALHEYLAADAMEHVSDLCAEVIRARTEGLPAPDNVACAFRRIRVTIDHTPLALCPGFLRIMPQGARLLAENGERDKALRLLDSWDRLVKREVERAWDPTWTTFALDRRAFEKLGDVYAELGYPERAEVTRARARRVGDAMRAWREDKMSGGSFAVIEKRGGFSARFGSFWPNERELETGRRLDQVLIEDAGLGVLTAFLFALLSICGLVTLRWVLDRRADAVPVAVMPTPQALAKIIGAGLVAPLAVYWAYSRLSGLAAREYSIGYMGHRFVLEAALLVVTVTALLVALSLRHARSRCADLGIPVPPRAPRWQRITGWSLLAAAGLACLFTKRGWGQWYALCLVGALMYGTMIGGVVVLYALAGRRRAHTRYKATAARMLVVPLALAILVLTLTVRPYLAAREKALVMADPALQMDDELMLPRSQAGIVRRFREMVLPALRADAERPSEQGGGS